MSILLHTAKTWCNVITFLSSLNFLTNLQATQGPQITILGLYINFSFVTFVRPLNSSFNKDYLDDDNDFDDDVVCR